MRNKIKKGVLVVAAHPDDEVLGCGATISKHVVAQDRVWVLILSEGIASRANLSTVQKNKHKKALLASARRANRILSVKRLIVKNFPDNQFDSVPLLKIIHSIEEVISEFKPDIVYTHHFGDTNIDHRRTLEAVFTAARPMEDSPVEEILSFEIPSSSEWNFNKQDTFRPNVFIDVKDSFDKKINALSEYKSELREFPHPRSLKYIESLARVRGGNVGFKKAEAFELVYHRLP